MFLDILQYEFKGNILTVKFKSALVRINKIVLLVFLDIDIS